jgi:hypothetical protein
LLEDNSKRCAQDHLWNRWFNFTARSEEQQKDINKLIVKLVTGCGDVPWRDLQGKNLPKREMIQNEE